MSAFRAAVKASIT